MPFLKSDKTLDDYLSGTHTDYFTPWSLVHDEMDLVVLKDLMPPLMKQIVKKSALKKLFGISGIPGMGVSFDVEYDNYNSWAATRTLNVYEYPLHRKENKLYQDWLRVMRETPKVVGKTYYLDSQDLTQDDLALIASLPEGYDTLIVKKPSGDIFGPSRKVDCSKLKGVQFIESVDS